MVAGAFGRDGVLDDGAGGLKIVTLDRSRDVQWDVVLARFSGDGALRWARVVGGPRTDAIRGLDVLPDGNLALLGLCKGAARLARSGSSSALIAPPISAQLGSLVRGHPRRPTNSVRTSRPRLPP